MAEEQQSSQTVAKPADAAPLESDIDSLLTSIPDLASVFAGTPEGQPETAKPEQPKEGVSKPEPETPAEAAAPDALESLIPEGMKPEEEKQKPPAEEAKKEEFSEKVQARINELTARRKTAEEKAAALEAELTELKARAQVPAVLAPSPVNPLSDIMNLQDLGKRKAELEEVKSWCIQNFDGGPVSDGKGGVKHIEAKEVREHFNNADHQLNHAVPDREKYLVSFATHDAEAKREYPAMYKVGTRVNQVFTSWLNVFPDIMRFPDYGLMIGDALVGQNIRLGRGKTNGKTAGALPPSAQIPLATPAPAASPRVPQTRMLSGDALRAAGDANPEGAVDAWISGLIDNSAAQR